MALPDLFARRIDRQDVWTQIVYVLLKLESEEDVAETRSQALHAAHLREVENVYISMEKKKQKLRNQKESRGKI